MSRLCVVLLASLLAASWGCASAYDQAYEEETQRLETEAAAEARAEQQRQQGAYDEASRYAAVVYFEVGSAVLSEKAHQELVWFFQQTAGAPAASEILVQGFADATGGDALNQTLSRERAESVAVALTALGVARSRMVVQGFASNFPAADNAVAEGRKNNRRVEVTLR